MFPVLIAVVDRIGVGSGPVAPSGRLSTLRMRCCVFVVATALVAPLHQQLPAVDLAVERLLRSGILPQVPLELQSGQLETELDDAWVLVCGRFETFQLGEVQTYANLVILKEGG